MSTQTTQTAETVKDVRVLVSFHAVREDGNVSNEPLHKWNFLYLVVHIIIPRSS